MPAADLVLPPPPATTSYAGTISAVDQTKLDGTPCLIIHEGGGSTAYPATSSTDVGYGTALQDALSVLATGETLLLGPGTFDISGSNYSIIPPSGIVMAGSGKDVTTIVKSDTPANQLLRVAILNLSSYSTFADFKIWGTSPTNQQSPVGCYRTASSTSNLAFVNALMLRLHMIGAVDSFHINALISEALTFSATMRDCVLDSGFDTVSLIAGGSSGTFEIQRCVLNAVYPNPTVAYQYPSYVDTIGFVTTAVKAFGNFRVNVRNSTLTVGGASSTNSAVQPRTAGADIRVYGGEIISSGTNALDIEIVAGSAGTDSATVYDRSKTSGTVARLNNSDQVSEGSTNLFYSDTRARASISGTTNRVTVTSGVIDISSAYVGQNTITTVGTVGTGAWQGTAIGVAYGGTNLASYTAGDILYASGSTTLSKLAANATATNKFLRTVSGGNPAYAQVDYADLSGAGSTAITTVGTIGTGTWQGTAVAVGFGGTGLASYTLGDTVYASGTTAISKLAGNTTTTRKFLRQTGNGSVSAAPAWDTIVAADVPAPGSSTQLLYNNAGALAGITSATWNQGDGILLLSGELDATAIHIGSGAQFQVDSTGGVSSSAGASFSGTILSSNHGDPIKITFDGGGSTLAAPSTAAFTQVDYSGTIQSYTILGDASGSVTVTLKKSTYSNFPTTSDITGGHNITLSSQQKNTDSTLTGWTTSLAAGDVLEWNISGTPATVKWVTVILKVKRA